MTQLNDKVQIITESDTPHRIPTKQNKRPRAITDWCFRSSTFCQKNFTEVHEFLLCMGRIVVGSLAHQPIEISKRVDQQTRFQRVAP